MIVKAKFFCSSVSKTVSNSRGPIFQYTYKFHAVYNNSEENKKYWEATPSGVIELTGMRDDLFEPGKEYYLEFTPA